MNTPWDRALSTLLTLAVVTMAGVLVYREFFSRPPDPPPRVAEYDPEWRDAFAAGRLVGNPQAPVMVVVFSDIECPFCQRFHSSLRTVLEEYPTEISYSFVHFPLDGHKHAMGAARVAECASHSGRFAQALDFMFVNQDSLGIRDWVWFADGAGITDQAGWASCMADTATPATIRNGLAQGAKMKIAGTPTVFLNGWRYPGTPSDAEFRQAVNELIAGRKPYDRFPANAIRAHQ